jgi:mannose-6-phosphate isomerase-like protein (cupin superfamily)
LTDTSKPEATHVDLATVLDGSRAQGAVWSHATTGVRAHVNSEVDVLLVAVEGQGRVVVGDVVHVLQAGQALVVPKGTRREIYSLGERFAYLTCHRRRPRLWPINVPRPAEERAG